MRYEVEAPEAFTLPGSLVSLARNATPAVPYWLTGYRYQVEHRPRVLRNWDNERTIAGDNIGTDADPEEVETVPFLLEVEGEFSSFNRDQASREAQGRAHLEDCTSELLERELWTGEIAQAAALPNKFLTEGTLTDTVTGLDIPKTIAALVGAGAQMIHAPLRVGASVPPEWRSLDNLNKLGFVVVAGKGYPDGDRIYGTELVNVRLSDIEVLPSFDQRTNTHTYLSQRLGAVDFAGPVLTARVTF